MRPVCLTCKVEYHCDKNGVFVQAGRNTLYSGDRWKCPRCGHTMVCGYGTPMEVRDEAMAKVVVQAVIP